MVSRIVGITLVAVISTGTCALAGAAETLGWKYSWTVSVEGAESIEWDNDMVSHIETRQLTGSVSGHSW